MGTFLAEFVCGCARLFLRGGLKKGGDGDDVMCIRTDFGKCHFETWSLNSGILFPSFRFLFM